MTLSGISSRQQVSEVIVIVEKDMRILMLSRQQEIRTIPMMSQEILSLERPQV